MQYKCSRCGKVTNRAYENMSCTEVSQYGDSFIICRGIYRKLSDEELFDTSVDFFL